MLSLKAQAGSHHGCILRQLLSLASQLKPATLPWPWSMVNVPDVAKQVPLQPSWQRHLTVTLLQSHLARIVDSAAVLDMIW